MRLLADFANTTPKLQFTLCILAHSCFGCILTSPSSEYKARCFTNRVSCKRRTHWLCMPVFDPSDTAVPHCGSDDPRAQHVVLAQWFPEQLAQPEVPYVISYPLSVVSCGLPKKSPYRGLPRHGLQLRSPVVVSRRVSTYDLPYGISRMSPAWCPMFACEASKRRLVNPESGFSSMCRICSHYPSCVVGVCPPFWSVLKGADDVAVISGSKDHELNALNSLLGLEDG